MDLELSCRCGKVRGRAIDAEPANINYCVCYCRDCRAFARWLGRMDSCDAAGGVPIVQMARSRVELDSGVDELACVRLSPKGLHRWYASCCKTPIGNTMPAMPFFGMIGAFFADEGGLERRYGAPWRIYTDRAIGPVPAHRWAGPMYPRVALLIARWALRGRKGATFFDPATGAPVVTPRVLTREERAAASD